jgi:microcin C transport system permease protein
LPNCSATTGRWWRSIGGQWYAPAFSNPSEKALGGDFDTATDWKDPLISELLAKPGNWALFTLNPHSADSLDYFDPALPPATRTPATGWAPTPKAGTCWPG